MTRDDYDVVIIGSGAGGGACLWALARRNVRVLLLEAGPAYDYRKDYRLHLAEWETTGFPDKVSVKGRQTFAPMQALDAQRDDLRSWNHLTGQRNRTSTRQPYAYHHVVGLGGSTLHYTGEAHRMHPDAMQMQTRFGVAADWPVSYSELEPYYQQAERITGVAGPEHDPVRWRSRPYPLPPHPFNYSSQPLKRGCDALGLDLVPNALAILSRPYDGRPGCNQCNNCNRGCPRGDKGSVDVTFIRQARRYSNCTVRTGATVIGIEAGDGDRISAVHYLDDSGAQTRIAARAVVIACGAVETPRLLLNSSGPHSPDGLANESGQVGRHFMETMAWYSSGLHADALGSHRGIPSDSICWDYNAPDAIEGVIGGCRFSSGIAEAELVGPINYARRVVGGWGREHKRRMRETFGHVLSVGALGESLPDEETCIDLDPQARDPHGLPRARIHSHLDEMAVRRLAFMAKTCRAILTAAGVDSLFEEYGTYDYFSATHVFGTCRMGTDPDSSVVDPFGRSHRWKNLFIADASVFPSSGGGEAPSLTIQALALRTGEHIAGLAQQQLL